jgi:hypothetical protein
MSTLLTEVISRNGLELFIGTIATDENSPFVLVAASAHCGFINTDEGFLVVPLEISTALNPTNSLVRSFGLAVRGYRENKHFEMKSNIFYLRRMAQAQLSSIAGSDPDANLAANAFLTHMNALEDADRPASEELKQLFSSFLDAWIEVRLISDSGTKIIEKVKWKPTGFALLVAAYRIALSQL